MRIACGSRGRLGSELSRYSGSKLDDLRKALAEEDREIIRLSRQQLRAKVFASARPPNGNGLGRKSSWTEMALIENETSKKQRYISVRDLTQRAGRALLELKPCWMMSPAVAQYVPKGSIHFDLCIIDEASQMPPESAIGALVRCGQAVVVGDTNQLPPSSFFKALIDDEEADEDETVLNESILEMANGTFRPARRLPRLTQTLSAKKIPEHYYGVASTSDNRFDRVVRLMGISILIQGNRAELKNLDLVIANNLKKSKWQKSYGVYLPH